MKRWEIIKVIKKLFFISFLLLVAVVSNAQDKTLPKTRILFVFDASRSMLEVWETDRRINIARNLLIEMVDSLEKLSNVQMALRVYGHQKPVPPQDCDDTRLEVPFGDNAASKIRQKLRYISPMGTTPIAHTLNKCGGDFPKCADCRNVIILITDGIEECGGDPCEVSVRLQKKGVALKPFVIGLGLDINFEKTFECMGTFYNAKNEDDFRNILNVVITQALNTTSLQVNLLDINGRPTESDVNMTFYDNVGNRIMHNYMHTINNRGVPDTVTLDPLINYSMVAHTLPPVGIDSLELIPGKHTIAAVDAPQGYLEVKDGGRNVYNPFLCIVRKGGEMNTLNVQNVNDKEKYIVGKYDLEILTLPRIYLYDVKVDQSRTTTIQIPQYGTLNIQKSTLGYGSIYVEKNNGMDWVCNLKPESLKETIRLQPGNYRLIWRAKHVRQCLYTFQKSFRIVSGSSELLKLN